MNLNDKVAVVTGASSGIGEAVAIALAERKVNLTLVARRADRLESVAQRVRITGGQALVAPADLRSEGAVLSVFEVSQERWGRLDILVNSAGVGIKAGLHDGSTEAWREMWEVNVLAMAIATREALRRFNPDTGGHIVNISSTSGHRVPPGGGFYAVTKFAVRALTEVLRQELAASGSPSKVGSVSPGRVATELFRGSQACRSDLDVGAELDPSDVARTVVHILESPEDVAIHDVILRSRKQRT